MSGPSKPSQRKVDVQNDHASPGKKQRASDVNIIGPATSTKLRPKGKLSLLMTMPLDILTEVFSRLQPLDLLHLGRSSKSLRLVFMSKHSQHIWRSSRGNVPAYGNVKFPELPPDLSEPAYASLAFEKWCLNCGKTPIFRFDFSCGERICRSCHQKKGGCLGKGLAQFIEVYEIRDGSRDDIPTIYSLVPMSTVNKCFSLPVARHICHQCTARRRVLSDAAYKEYLTRRRATVDKIKESKHGDHLNAWEMYRRQSNRRERGTKQEQRGAAQQIEDQRAREITAKFLDLG